MEEKEDLKVLILEDVRTDAELLKLQLVNFDFHCIYQVVDAQEAYEKALSEFKPDVILADFNLPQFDGLQALKKLRSEDELTPFIFVTGTLFEEDAVFAIRAEATDFILKKHIEQLPSAIIKALRERHEKILRFEATRMLAESEKRFKTLVQNSGDVIAILDFKGNYQFVSDSSRRILGISPASFEGKNVYDFIHSEDKQLILDQLHQLQKQTQMPIGPLRFKDGNGTWRWIEAVASNLLNDSTIQGIVINSRDVTERVEKELALKVSNERYRFASLATQDLIYEWVLQSGQIIIMEGALERLFGHFDSGNGTELAFWKDHIHPHDLAKVYCKLREKLKNSYEDFCENEFRFGRPDGTYAIVYNKGYIIRNETGKAIKIIGALRDNTERLENLKAIRDQNIQLRKISWVQSHIVRAPVARIMGLVDLVTNYENDETTKSELLRYIDLSAKELDEVIRDITKKAEILVKEINQ
ncbi:PAS domain-containing protein [uncultured Imperialibacter sp.]|uniref:response regulator n=1 Tax=uncultured Imperialibacter sp. TaxID=1672639 RepID=UPI0030D713F3|tara:strand:- start:8355 stop:9770 length:1416 start_codon:yes stop_codon:yes gene_type:complete